MDLLINRDLLVVGRFLLVSQLGHQTNLALTHQISQPIRPCALSSTKNQTTSRHHARKRRRKPDRLRWPPSDWWSGLHPQYSPKNYNSRNVHYISLKRKRFPSAMEHCQHLRRDGMTCTTKAMFLKVRRVCITNVLILRHHRPVFFSNNQTRYWLTKQQ